MASETTQKEMASTHIEESVQSDQAGTLDQLDPKLHVKEALDEHVDLDHVAVKKVVRKIDIRLIPTLAVLYAIALIDRGNLPNVRSLAVGRDIPANASQGPTSWHGQRTWNLHRQPVFYIDYDGKTEHRT